MEEDKFLINYFLPYLKKERQRITNRNKYLNVSASVYAFYKFGGKIKLNN